MTLHARSPGRPGRLRAAGPGLLVAAFLPSSAPAQPASATGTAAAQVVSPLTLAREADLDFGTIAMAPGSPGTVSVAPQSGGIDYAGGASGVCAAACPPPHPARFIVSGEPGRSYRIAVPPSLTITAPGAAGPAGVIVDSLVARAVSNPGDSGGVLSSTGADAFEVGGTLHLPAGASPGHYTTQVPVIVSYP